MEKRINIEVVLDSNDNDMLLCKDVISTLNSNLFIVHKVNINDKPIYNYEQGGFISND